MKIKVLKISMLFLLLSILNGCKITSRYELAYNVISKDFFGKETSTKQFGKDVSGVYVFDSIYAYPQRKLTNDESIIFKKGMKVIGVSKVLKKMEKDYYNKNWLTIGDLKRIYGDHVLYEATPNGPLSAAVFSEIKDDQLRIDVIPFFIKTPKYCGSVNKYYFKFSGKKIIENKKWVDHYECW
ncbi:hypothetical protein J2787_000763 [Chryseobacterium rhizosphaerae]|uniref:Uncharacterized protein n=1 Tax=Chryseobacterium rhizosphaerae TaxID=395937 RepID=A0AAE4C1D9_9FLAO|nr:MULTISPECIES: hypothetical protein [Chryseobacterium]MBL3549231.1 hypothetical protein [Chryseobacterium sp. KMC2]MDR6525393.1 hypothetical protein [Chryseobacterium rhizosphaerae]